MRNRSILLLATMVLWIPAAADARYSGGTGEPNDPYRIATAEDLNDIGNHEDDWDKNFVLVNDVNLAQYTGTQFKIIGNSATKFTGVFDGNDNKVWNFTWTSESEYTIGLFGDVGSGGQIKNLGMENVNINAGTGVYVGGMVGQNGGTINNCYSSGSILTTDWYYVGGLVGLNYYCGTITNCYSASSVSGGSLVGGLAGGNTGTITKCYSLGSVSGDHCVGGLVGNNHGFGTITNGYSTGTVSGNEYIGGLVGLNYEGTISSCYCSAKVSGVRWYVGGLVGENYYGTISECYSTGSVTGQSSVGGLVGENGHLEVFCEEGYCWEERYPGWIYRCYSIGNVTGNYTITIGGLVGCHAEGEIGDCFWDVNTSTQTTSAGGTPKTTAEMKTIDTFIDAGWDFAEVWGIGEHQTYPFLRQSSAGDINLDKRVDLLDFAIFASHWLEEK